MPKQESTDPIRGGNWEITFEKKGKCLVARAYVRDNEIQVKVGKSREEILPEVYFALVDYLVYWHEGER